MDLANFPPEFTDEPVRLTPDDTGLIDRIDQSEFDGFEYINPLLLLGGVPRAVLLPCCEPIAAAQPMVLRSPASSISPMPLAAATVLSWPVTATESIPVSDRTVLRSPDTVAAVISSASTTTS